MTLDRFSQGLTDPQEQPPDDTEEREYWECWWREDD